MKKSSDSLVKDIKNDFTSKYIIYRFIDKDFLIGQIPMAKQKFIHKTARERER